MIKFDETASSGEKKYHGWILCSIYKITFNYLEQQSHVLVFVTISSIQVTWSYNLMFSLPSLCQFEFGSNI